MPPTKERKGFLPRAFQFRGATGVEWCEPRSFNGRKSGGLPDGHTGRDPWALYSPATVPAADAAKGAYRSDVSGYDYQLCGHWLDREYTNSSYPHGIISS
ncbi:MAG TPA: hypothetical protein VNV86_20085 [Candidatus Acidoferrum sp.]|nr:hypothetical protein [Candidatus Acidoferrum sp.]